MKHRKPTVTLVLCALVCCFEVDLLAGNVLHTVYGDAASQNLGWSANGAGDVNNDGFDDFVVGASGDNTNGTESGMIRVYSGQTGAVLYSRYGDASGDRLGRSVSGAGDVNNDGYADFIAGAGGHDGNGSNSGMIRVYSGQTGAVLYSLYGDWSGDRLGEAVNWGCAVSGAGDVNNDGYDDFMAGAPHNYSFGGVGLVRVYSGQTGAVLYTRYGDAMWDWLGQSVSGAGDVDNDGYDDFIAGAPSDGTTLGMIRVYSGQNGAVLYERQGGGGSLFGWSVSGAGDVNNDGHADFVVGAPWDWTNGYSSGLIIVFSGQTGAVLFSRHGAENSNLGASVSSAGDLDRDGYDDFCGEKKVYSGQSGAVLYRFPISSWAKRLAGDVNADGTPDFIVGIYNDDANGTDAGKAVVFTGPWTDLGSGLAGTGGVAPLLVGTGSLQPGTSATLTLSNALAGSQAWLIIGLSRVDVPFKGGTLVPSQDFLLPGLPVDGSGELVIGANWPAVPSGTAIFFQYWVVDPAGPIGVSASNGLKGKTR